MMDKIFNKNFCRHLLSFFVVVTLAMAFSACTTVKKLNSSGKDSSPKVVYHFPKPEGTVNEGSLWQESGLMSDLYRTPKAGRVGDIVTVKIVESASASNNAKTNVGRKSSITASIDKLLGVEKRYTDSAHPKYKAFPNYNPFSGIAGNISSKFDGSGATKRSGDLSAYITARVTRVLANGNLEIVGYREITVNYETQMISLTGIVRPTDISPKNVVLSTYISDAKIVYSGSGIIQKRQRPGWLASLINVVWPF